MVFHVEKVALKISLLKIKFSKTADVELMIM